MGPNSSIILKEEISRCKIQEFGSDEEGIPLYGMNISNL